VRDDLWCSLFIVLGWLFLMPTAHERSAFNVFYPDFFLPKGLRGGLGFTKQSTITPALFPQLAL